MSTLLNIFYIISTMTVVYELICPMTQGVVYVGMSKDVKKRYFQHIWGDNNDSKQKANWRDKLKSLGLTPTLIVVDSYETKEEAKKAENRHIAKRIKEGCDLFNIADRDLYYQYTKDGELVNVYHTLREIKKETGITVHLDRHTSGGYIWTVGEFDSSKLDNVQKAKEAKCKRVAQYTKGGELVGEFKGVREAGRQTGIDHRSIQQVAAGSKIRKSAGGYKWKYI